MEHIPIQNYFNQQTFIILISLTVALYAFKKWVNGTTFDTKGINLKGKVAVITGGNGGIGFEVAKTIALLGCKVIIGARNKTNAVEAIKLIKKIDPQTQV